MDLIVLAKEALKPTSVVVETLLAPPIRRLRTWAEERDIKARVYGEELEQAFTSYLQRLLRRVSGIQTVVFPEQILPLPDLYEPLSLSGSTRSKVSEETLRSEGMRSYIIDDGGMGKSTFLRHIVLQCIAEGDWIPILVELRSVPQGMSIIEAIAREFDNYRNRFDREVLTYLLEHGKLLILLDAFDEVAAENRAFLAREIELLAVNSTYCAIILTSRPQVSLPFMPHPQTFKIVPLKLSQAESIVRRLDSIASISVGERLIERFSIVPEQFLASPLLVALLYRTFGFNGSISDKIVTFYDELFAAMYKGHDLTKAGFARPKLSNLDIDSFRRLVQGLAFLLISLEKNALSGDSEALRHIGDAARLTNIQIAANSDFLQDLLVSVPLFIRDGREIRFLHKSVAEFFAAEYLAYSPDREDALAAIASASNIRQFAESLNFLGEISPELIIRFFAAPLAQTVLDYPLADDPIIRTANFLGGVAISLWSEDERNRQNDRNNFIGIDPPDEHRRALYFFYGDRDGEEHTLSIAIDDGGKAIASAAWVLVTKPYPYKDQGHIEHDFMKLRFPTQEWFYSDDPLCAEIWKDETVKAFVAKAFDSAPIAGLRQNPDMTRVIDNSAAQEVLRSVRAADDTRDWLARLLKRAD